MQSMPTSPKAIQIFYSYVPEDEEWQKKLEAQLSENGLISQWHYGLIDPGKERQREIDEHLNAAHILLLLVSPDFLTSDHCVNIEVKKALERHEKNDAHVIPVILRPSNWKTTQFGKLQFLPRNGKPVSQWENSETPLFHIAEEIRTIVKKLAMREWLNEGYTLCDRKYYEKALRAFDNALSYDPFCVEAHNAKGDVYYALKNDKEALDTYEYARKLDPRNTWAWHGTGNVYLRLKDDEKALDAFQQVTTFDPGGAWAWYEQGKIQKRFNCQSEALDAYERAIVVCNDPVALALFHHDKGVLYEELNQYAEALAEAEKALSFDPERVSSYRNKGHALNKLGRFDEALEVFEEAIRRKPHYPNAHQGKATALKGQERYKEALQEIEEAIRLKRNYMWAWKNKETTLKLLAQQAREEAERYDKLAQEASEKAQQFGYKK